MMDVLVMMWINKTKSGEELWTRKNEWEKLTEKTNDYRYRSMAYKVQRYEVFLQERNLK